MVKITVPLLISSFDGVYVGARMLGLENEPVPLVDHANNPAFVAVGVISFRSIIKAPLAGSQKS